MNLLGIDFEDWYHPELIQDHIENKEYEPTMHKGLDKILNLLEKNDTYATFFVVGELIEKNPEILDMILSNDHEIAFHTMNHTRIDSINFQTKFGDELKQFSKLTNKKSKGFRAPSFSLNPSSSWIIDELMNFDYQYDSSVVPTKTRLYGLPNAETNPYKISSNSLEKNDPNGNITEFPIMITKFLGKKTPAGGGFYLRLLPTRIIENAIKNYENQNMPATFYIHSWELTPEFMPKIKLPYKEKFVTYYNINQAYTKMHNLLKKFNFTSFEKFLQK
tara:strand:- start:1351 stop:2178 length:828 start_codon:yes stop_codon:yes gene_type:complete